MSATDRKSAHKLRALLISALAVLLALAAAACGDDEGSSSGGGDGGKVNVVAYSTPETVYQEVLEPAFQKTGPGKGVDFSSSFGGSGDQSRAVEAGQPASVVHLSLEPDMTRLVDAGIVSPDWNKQKFNGIAQKSVVVIVTRKGNPEGIKSFDDLLTKDVEIVTPNPFASGGARWNLLAVYGAALQQGKSKQEALKAIETVLSKTVTQPGSASDSLTAYTQGQGDVLLAYENEAIRAQNEGEDVDYVIPDDTILIETPIALTEDAPDSAGAFLDFLWSDKGQQLWADNGYRPANPKLVDPKQYPNPSGLFTIADLGGWEKVNDELFDETDGEVARIEQGLGVSTAG
ncbi:MAG TPA: extracellular solute-binding protein [Solirubrobacterales bacterium]|nr:extracellular solute-binding protein [Solirubrobacterales bacterium]